MDEAPDDVGPIRGAAGPFLRPLQYFDGMRRSGGWGRPALRVLVWSFAGGAVGAALSRDPRVLIAVPLLGLAASLPGALLLHGVCRLLGGQAGFQASYRIVAALAVLAPVAAAAVALPYGPAAANLYALYLTVAAAVAVHRVRPGPALAAFGLLALLASVFGVRRQEEARERAAAEAESGPVEGPRRGVFGEPPPVLEEKEAERARVDQEEYQRLTDLDDVDTEPGEKLRVDYVAPPDDAPAERPGP